ncbi:hypothetical protein D3C73_1483690 [compost metagenome]
MYDMNIVDHNMQFARPRPEPLQNGRQPGKQAGIIPGGRQALRRKVRPCTYSPSQTGEEDMRRAVIIMQGMPDDRELPLPDIPGD